MITIATPAASAFMTTYQNIDNIIEAKILDNEHNGNPGKNSLQLILNLLITISFILCILEFKNRIPPKLEHRMIFHEYLPSF